MRRKGLLSLLLWVVSGASTFLGATYPLQRGEVSAVAVFFFSVAFIAGLLAAFTLAGFVMEVWDGNR